MAIHIIQRDLTATFHNFTRDFTSFDRCMRRDLCKIPFIIVCVVGGLIALSLLMCCIRCVMCGYACCSCCCGGCGGRPSRRHRHRKHSSDTVPFVQQQPPPFIQQQPLVIHQPIISHAPPPNEPPQYAYFDSKSEDALPAMPTLQEEKVLVESHEMKRISDPYSMRGARVASPAPSHQTYHTQHDYPTQNDYPTRRSSVTPSNISHHTQLSHHTPHSYPMRAASPFYHDHVAPSPAVTYSPPQHPAVLHPGGGMVSQGAYVDDVDPYQYERTPYSTGTHFDPHNNRPTKEWAAV